MVKKIRKHSEAGAPPLGLRPRSVAPATANNFAPFTVRRWSLQRKQEVVLRLLRGEAVEALSRELGVESYRLEEWREKALLGMESALRERAGDPLSTELDQAKKRIGELSLENELLRRRIEKNSRYRPRGGNDRPDLLPLYGAALWDRTGLPGLATSPLDLLSAPGGPGRGKAEAGQARPETTAER